MLEAEQAEAVLAACPTKATVIPFDARRVRVLFMAAFAETLREYKMTLMIQ
jgi:hypothetical protein